jgi:hypothetical protein
MVRDDRITGAGEGNWVFVPLSCLRQHPSELPENSNERLPPPPSVSTGEATGLAPRSAVLSGSVNPNGLDTHYYIEWGTEASKPYEAFEPRPYPGEDIGAGQEVVNRSINATGLRPGTVYYYRIVASSPTGVSEGTVRQFATPAEPPSVTTGAPAKIQFQRATLSGTVNPNGTDAHYYFQYGTSPSYGFNAPAPPGNDAGSGSGSVEVSVPIVELNRGTTYHYRMVAVNGTGIPVYGNDETLTTAAPPGLSITTPAPLPSSMMLTWTASANAASYTIVRNGEAVGSTATLMYVDTKLHPATFYHYEVVANDESESAGSNIVTRATTTLNTVKPDFSGDGKTDLGYIYPGGYIDTFLSNGSGIYEKKVDQVSKEFNSTGGTWLTGDFNGDGKADLVYIYQNYIDTFLSKGDGTYEEKQLEVSKEFNSVSGSWEVGDFNGDGKTDLAYIVNNYIDTFLSKGNGTYEEKQLEVSKEFNSVSGSWEVGDFNGDGKTDLAYIVNNYIDTFLSKGNGTYEEKQLEVSKEFNSVSGSWEVGDFNGDGKTDLAYIVNNYIDTFLSKGNGTYEEKQLEVSKEFNSVSGQWRIGDFNGDGKTDLTYIVQGGYLDTFLSKGDGTYEEKQQLIESGFDVVSGLWL